MQPCGRRDKHRRNLVEAQPDLDFVFFDLPGTINNADVVQTISKMDYIFTPIIADRVVMESSIKFATVINEQMISTGKSGIKGIYLVWNMVDGREKTELYKAYDKVCAEFALPIWKHTCLIASVFARKRRQNARRYSDPQPSLRTRR